MGDQPPMLPATMPAMAAAGPKADVDRERPTRCLVEERRDSGVVGALWLAVSLPPRSPSGVRGIELVRDRERDPLLDAGRRYSTGCSSL